VSDEGSEFAVLYSVLVRERPQWRYELRELFNAVRWVVRAGAPWRHLPWALPPWEATRQQTQRRVIERVFAWPATFPGRKIDKVHRVWHDTSDVEQRFPFARLRALSRNLTGSVNGERADGKIDDGEGTLAIRQRSWHSDTETPAIVELCLNLGHASRERHRGGGHSLPVRADSGPHRHHGV
jgi:transposase